MGQWDWLTQPEKPYSWSFAVRVLLKALVLLLVINVIFALILPLPGLGNISWYNVLVPGRLRLPYGENPAQSYNLSLNNLNAMFASHLVDTPKADDEYRVLMIGDSSLWGVLLQPQETLVGLLDAAGETLDDGRQVRVYNLGYPIMSLTKDLMLLDVALRYEPDLIVWPLTLESFPRNKQLFPPLVQNNPEPVRALIEQYDLALDVNDEQFVDLDLVERSVFGQRRALADLLRLQVYGILWGATGVDQYYPETYTPRQEDFEEDITFHDWSEPLEFTEQELAFDVLRAGVAHAGDVPVLLINEPTFVSEGENSDLRYNFFYPRWAYDTYRALLHETAAAEDWLLLDAWDVVGDDQYTDSAVHYTPLGAEQLAAVVSPAILAVAEDGQLP